MNIQVNQDIKNLTNCLNANKNCLNISKTEVVLFKPSKKLRLNGKILYPTVSVKFFDINIDGYLNWKLQISDVAIKLNMANTILSKLI